MADRGEQQKASVALAVVGWLVVWVSMAFPLLALVSVFIGGAIMSRGQETHGAVMALTGVVLAFGSYILGWHLRAIT